MIRSPDAGEGAGLTVLAPVSGVGGLRLLIVVGGGVPSIVVSRLLLILCCLIDLALSRIVCALGLEWEIDSFASLFFMDAELLLSWEVDILRSTIWNGAASSSDWD
jgi:hypothetical protein